MYQTDPPRSQKEALPIMYDLLNEDLVEPDCLNSFHLLQPCLLRNTFCPPVYPVEQLFVASGLNYYHPHHANWYKQLDWFARV